MSVAEGPLLQTSGLILSLDAANIKSIKGRRSLINWESWAAGQTGSVGIYGQNGDGNSRISDVNPWGVTDVVWDVSNQDATSDADGGWNTSSFTVDSTQRYRFSVWMKRKVIGNGSSYLGCAGNVINRSDGVTVNTNPYFRASGWWGNANQWYLLVGHVWPSGTGAGSAHPDSGVYDTAGTKVTTNSDFIFQAGVTASYHRSYLYYSTDIATNQQFYQPRVDLCDGSEPSIAELLNNAGNKWNDLANVVNAIPEVNFPPIATDVTACYDFSANAGLNASTAVYGFKFSPQPIPNTGSFTFNTWVKNVPASVGQQLLFSNTADGNAYRFGIGVNGIYYLIGPTYQEGTLTFPSFTNTQWNNVCVVYDRAGVVTAGTPKVYLYLNGELVNSTTIPASQTAWTTSGYTTAYMAKWGGPTFSSFSGKLAKFEIYNQALSAATIYKNFNALRSRFRL